VSINFIKIDFAYAVELAGALAAVITQGSDIA
jgi:hypothetical protein